MKINEKEAQVGLFFLEKIKKTSLVKLFSKSVRLETQLNYPIAQIRNILLNGASMELAQQSQH